MVGGITGRDLGAVLPSSGVTGATFYQASTSSSSFRDGDHTIGELAELFAVSRATIYREIARATPRHTVR